MLDRRTAYRPSSAQEQFIVPLLRENIDAALAHFATVEDGLRTVLDVGCGEQPLRTKLTAMGYNYFSADVQQNSTDTVDVLTPIDQPLPEMLVLRGPFDFILCTEVLEHVPDWNMAFKNIAGLLRPGGRALLTCPHFYPLHEVPHDHWRPTPYSIHYFATRVGLKVLMQKQAGDGLEVIGTALAAVKAIPRESRLSHRVLAHFCNLSRKAAFVFLRTGFLRRRITSAGGLYLSNIAVLERPRNSSS